MGENNSGMFGFSWPVLLLIFCLCSSIVLSIMLSLKYKTQLLGFQNIGNSSSNPFLLQFYNYPGNIANQSLLGGYVPPYLETLPDTWIGPGSQTAYKLSDSDFISILTNQAQCPNDRRWFQLRMEDNKLCGYCSQ